MALYEPDLFTPPQLVKALEFGSKLRYAAAVEPTTGWWRVSYGEWYVELDACRLVWCNRVGLPLPTLFEIQSDQRWHFRESLLGPVRRSETAAAVEITRQALADYLAGKDAGKAPA